MPFDSLTAEQRREASRLSARARKDGKARTARACAASVEMLLADQGGPLPSWAQQHVAGAKAGRMRSLLVLKCGDCSGWQKGEITRCAVGSCPLHAVRPFQGKGEAGAADGPA
jgi:hypothetical protein